MADTVLLLRSQDRDAAEYPDWRDFRLPVPAAAHGRVFQTGEVLSATTDGDAFLSLDVLDDKEVAAPASTGVPTLEAACLDAPAALPAVVARGGALMAADRWVQPPVRCALRALTQWSVVCDGAVTAAWEPGAELAPGVWLVEATGGDEVRVASNESPVGLALASGGLQLGVASASVAQTRQQTPEPRGPLRVLRPAVPVLAPPRVAGYTAWGSGRAADGEALTDLTATSVVLQQAAAGWLVGDAVEVVDASGAAASATLTRVEGAEVDLRFAAAVPALADGATTVGGETVSSWGNGLGLAVVEGGSSDGPAAAQQLDLLCGSAALAGSQLFRPPLPRCVLAPLRERPAQTVAATREGPRELAVADVEVAVGDVLVSSVHGRFAVAGLTASGSVVVARDVPDEPQEWSWVDTAPPRAGSLLQAGGEGAVIVSAALRVSGSAVHALTSAPLPAGAVVACGDWLATVAATSAAGSGGLAWDPALPAAARVLDLAASSGIAGAVESDQGLALVARAEAPWEGVVRAHPAGFAAVADGLPAGAQVVLARTDGTMVADGASADGARSTDAQGLVVGADRQPTRGVWWPTAAPAPASLRAAQTLSALGAELAVSASPIPAGRLLVDAAGLHCYHEVGGQAAAAAVVHSGALTALTDDRGAQRTLRLTLGPGFGPAGAAPDFRYTERVRGGGLAPASSRGVDLHQLRPVPGHIHVRLLSSEGRKVAGEGSVTVTLRLDGH